MHTPTGLQSQQHRFGELAIELGLITKGQLDMALDKQRGLHAGGGKTRVGEVLIMMNLLNVEQVKKVLSEQRKRRTADANKILPMEYFGEYKLLSKLGEGGMGSVYKAQETLANRVVALKVLRRNLAANALFTERFEREAKLAGSLSHPNIVACHNAGVSRGIQFMVMEFVEGDTLRTRLLNAGGKLPEDECLRICRDIAAGLLHAHSKGIVHRDIKPENILFSREGIAKISDFGTAKSFLDEESLTQTGAVIGTPYYISPEQVRADKDIDHRADLYALGGTLYHMLTGHTPFEAPSALEIMRLHLEVQLENPADLNPDLSLGVVQVVTKLMAKAPADRYQTAQELMDDIDRVLRKEEPLNATLDQHRSSIRPPRIPRKKPRRTAGCAGVLAVLGTVSWALAQTFNVFWNIF
ncbi:MAG TPA: serine/threonine-protein kinase [Planctomycetota bacterium]|jgi:serine/threonine-protein kinase